MISFGMTEEQELVRDTLREFAVEVMRPIARECDESASIPGDFLNSVWELGLTSTQIPAEFGGTGPRIGSVANTPLVPPRDGAQGSNEAIEKEKTLEERMAEAREIPADHVV